MKKPLLAILALTLLLLSSCLPDTPPPPYGVWISEEPIIVLYFKPEFRAPTGQPSYFGTYTIDGVTKKILAHFGNGLWFTLYDLTEPNNGWEGEIEGIQHSGMLLAGSYRIVGNEIHYRISPYAQERLGVDRIIFQLTEDYEPLNL